MNKTQSMPAGKVTRENLREVVTDFYTKAIADDLLGPVFVDLLGDAIESEPWQEHIELIVDFWASVALGDEKYQGSPFTPHIKLKKRLSIASFERFMELFFASLNAVYEPKLAQAFLGKTRQIAGNFIRNLGLDTAQRETKE